MKRLQELRIKLGLSQADLEKLTGIDANNFSRYERGIVVPSVEAVQKIARALGVTVDELINGPTKQEFEVKILMGVKYLIGAGIEIADNTFAYGVDDSQQQITFSGKIRIDTPEDCNKAWAKIIKGFKVACRMHDKKAEIDAEDTEAEF